ncbi:MAG: glycosyltransferase [Nanoarchaeota archaeon]|nr:glycosyltransferase [Nanoarchaeota archaeon]
MIKNKNIAVVYFSHDGISSLYTGVGTSGRDICLSMQEIRRSLNSSGYDVIFFPGTIRYTKEFHGYSLEVRDLVSKIAQTFGTEIIEVENGSGGTLSYGNVNYWIEASKNAAKEIDNISAAHDYVIALSSDTPFAGVAQRTTANNITHVWIPRSTAKIHSDFKLREEDGSMGEFMETRVAWEDSAIKHANDNSNAYIGYIGEFVKNHLVSEYAVKEEALIEMRIGLYYPRLDTYKKAQGEIKAKLIEKSIPINKNLLVSFARTEHYKGLDLVLKLGGYLEEKYNLVTVILTVPYSMDDPYIRTLENIREAYTKDAQILYGHDFITPHYLMQWENTRIIAVLSRQEPTGLVPNECRYYKNPNAQLLISNKDGLPERVTDGVDGFICDIDNMENIKEKAEEVVRLSKEKKEQICTNGYQTVTERYDLPTNMENMLKTLLDRI